MLLDAISISIVGSVGHSQVLFLKSMNIKDNEVGPLCPLGSLGSLGLFGVFGVFGSKWWKEYRRHSDNFPLKKSRN